MKCAHLVNIRAFCSPQNSKLFKFTLVTNIMADLTKKNKAFGRKMAYINIIKVQIKSKATSVPISPNKDCTRNPVPQRKFRTGKANSGTVNSW